MADTFFSDLEAIRLNDAPVRTRYDALARLIYCVLDDAAARATVSLAGPYAKTNYLLNQIHAAPEFAAAVNRARARFRNRGEMSDKATEAAFADDLPAVVSFIAELTGSPVPDGLPQWSEKKTKHLKPTATERGTAPYTRVVVVGNDGVSLAVREEDDNEAVYNISLDNPRHAYLSDIVRPGDELNLINPRAGESGLDPEYIIYDPDFLVNVTEIAGCFEDYGISPLTGIVNRFAAMDNTSAINLGNFASQLLDEEINADGDEAPDFRTSSVNFFRSNAVNLATCRLDSDFREQALRQAANIRRAVRTILPGNVRDFNTSRVILEPAFFSEMLGLQGRMDLMQSDYRLVLEQKSGKGAYAPGADPNVPRHARKHYVQLLLYMAIMRLNYRAIYEANGRNMNAFLMYSRYSEPVIGLGMAPDLLRQALEVRNMTVAYNRRLAAGDMDWLLGLTPETLAPAAGGRFWERYIRPRLASVLDVFASADPLSMSYFRRMLRFTSLEHRVAKTGSSGKRASGLASAWQCSLAEKLEGGNVYAGLRLVEPHRGHTGHVGAVVLEFGDDEANDLANFRTGDSVLLYAYPPGKEPDVRSTMVFRCSVTSIGKHRIDLRLRFSQSSALPFVEKESDLWAIEHDFMDSSFNGLYKGLHDFLTAPAGRRDLILCRRRPRPDKSLRTTFSHGRFDSLALKALQARDLFLIIGPPGTGKTSFGLTTTLREELARPGSSVLLVSYTNRAVDEICSKLIEEGIDFMRVGSETACDDAFRPFVLKEKVSSCSNVSQVRNAIAGTRVFAGTVSALNASVNLLAIKHFSLMIVDEASQILEPHLLPLLCRKNENGQPEIEKIVMIGDHKQLPAVVQQQPEESAVTEPELNEIGLTDCRMSLFERLLRRYGNDPDITYMLTRQGRMHREIAEFPNNAFYCGRLDTAGLPHQSAPLEPYEPADAAEAALTRHRVAFINVVEPFLPGEPDKINRAEAETIARLTEDIVRLNPGFDAGTLGIIVPYRNQIAAVRKLLIGRGLPAEMITIDTVERFQGSQRKYIVYGFTVKRSTQLKFLTDNTFTDIDGTVVDRKLNVAMTRAREHMVLVGNVSLLEQAPVFRNLIAYCKEKEALY